MARPFIVDPGAGGGGSKAMMAMAMELLGGEGKDRRFEQKQALAERQQRAAEMYQQGQLSAGQEANKLAREQFEAGQKELERTRTEAGTEKIQARMDAAEKAAEELRKTKAEEEYKNKNLQIGAIDKLREREIISKDAAEALYQQINPEYADIARGLKERETTTAVEQKLAEFKGMTPKQRAEVTKKDTSYTPEVLRRLQQQLVSEPAPVAEPGMLDKLKALAGQPSVQAPPGPVSPTTFKGYDIGFPTPSGRRGYGAAPQGEAGVPVTDVLMNLFAEAGAPSRPGYYTPAARPPSEPSFEYLPGGPSAVRPPSLQDLLSKALVGGFPVAPY